MLLLLLLLLLGLGATGGGALLLVVVLLLPFIAGMSLTEPLVLLRSTSAINWAELRSWSSWSSSERLLLSWDILFCLFSSCCVSVGIGWCLSCASGAWNVCWAS